MILKAITPELKKFICEGFVLIKESEYSDREKIAFLDKLLSLGAGAGWRPNAITIGAMRLFIDNQFKLPKGLERAHINHRRETMKELLKRDWLGDEWWDWYKERDYTVLAKRSENRDEKNFSSIQIFEIPLHLNLFLGKRVGFAYGNDEKDFIMNLAKDHHLL